MYIARFSYDFLPIHREQALAPIQQEVASAQAHGLTARLLIPLTRGPGGAALQGEVYLDHLDQLDEFRTRGMGSEEATGTWMRELSALLTAPSTVEILRVVGSA